MSDQTPGQDVFQAPEPQAAGGAPSLTPGARQHLEKTRPWVRVMSVVLFFSAGFTMLMGTVVGGITLAAGMASGGRSQALGAIGAVLLGLLYVGLGAMYVPPALFLHRYARALSGLALRPTSDALEQALGHQKSFWKYIGIMTLVASVVGLLGLVAAIAIGALGAVLAGAR